MIQLLLTSLSVYAIIKWWFDTSIMDHIIPIFTLGRYEIFSEFKDAISNSAFGRFFVELFGCPWCLTFHVSFWVNVILTDFECGQQFTLFVLASSGLGMLLYRYDLKE